MMNVSNELSLRDFRSLLRRGRDEMLIWWALITLIVAVYTFFMKPVFRAEVLMRLQLPEDMTRSIQIDASAILGGSAAEFNVDSLISPESLNEALRLSGAVTDKTVETQKAEKINDLAGRIRVAADGSDIHLVHLSVTANNGAQAAAEANFMAQAVEHVVSEQMAAKTYQAKNFIQIQLKKVEGNLHETEEKLRRFQEKIGPASAGTYLMGRLMELKTRQTQLSQKYTSSFPELQRLNKEIHSIEAQLQKLPNQEIDAARLTRDVQLNTELFTMLMKRLEDAKIIESARLAPIVIVERALTPTRPERPNKPFNVAAGCMLGFLVACAMIWVRHQLDTTLITTHDIESMLQLPVLAMVPRVERRNRPEDRKSKTQKDHLSTMRSRLIAHFPPKSPVVEVYHILRTNLPKEEIPTGKGRVVMFTSAVVKEGKSLTAANFAIAAAQSGIPTLLVEADLRKPTVDRLFGLPQEPGITNFFYTSPLWENYVANWEKIQKGEGNFGEAINTAGMENLHVLTAGKLPPNPIGLLSSDRYRTLLDDMRMRYSLIVVDCAPVMLFADCTVIAPHADHVILVYRFGKTDRDALKQTHHQLVSVKAKVLGVVVNDMLKGEETDYSPYYSSYQTPAPEVKKSA